MALIKLLMAKQKMEKGKEALKESVAAVKKEAGLDKTADKVIQKAKTDNLLLLYFPSVLFSPCCRQELQIILQRHQKKKLYKEKS